MSVDNFIILILLLSTQVTTLVRFKEFSRRVDNLEKKLSDEVNNDESR